MIKIKKIKMKYDNGIEMSKINILLNVQCSEFITHCSSIQFNYCWFIKLLFWSGVNRPTAFGSVYSFNHSRMCWKRSITRTLFIIKWNYFRFLMCRRVLSLGSWASKLNWMLSRMNSLMRILYFLWPAPNWFYLRLEQR